MTQNYLNDCAIQLIALTSSQQRGLAMKHPRIHVITKKHAVMVHGTLPGVTVRDVTVTDRSVILVGEHHGHQFVQELPLEFAVDTEHVFWAFHNDTLAVLAPRGEHHGMV